MTPDLSQSAITNALSSNWKEAIKINLEILKKSPHDIDTLNRLGRAYLETGLKSKSAEVYNKVLHLDKFNPIATKNLNLLKTSTINRNPTKMSSTPIIPLFLEEPGVTRTASLIRLGDPKIISRLHPGDSIKIAVRGHSVSVISAHGEYLGRLPDDLSSRLRTFIKAGSTYSAWIRSIDLPAGRQATQNIKIFIKEVARANKYKHITPFPPTEKLTYAAFTPPELVHEEKPDVSATEEQEESSELEDRTESEESL